jgi:alpha-mannosidase
MTSSQVFGTVENPFTALQFMNICNEERSLIHNHDGIQKFIMSGDGIWNILTMYDLWDEAFLYPHLNASIRLLPHAPLSDAQRWKLAQEFTRPPMLVTAGHPIGGLPRRFAPVSCEAENVAVTAFYREHETAGRGFPGYCGAGMGYPFIVRLVELDGVATEARLRVAGPVRAAYRTKFPGEIIEPLTPSSEHLPRAGPVTWEDVVVALRPFEIATLYLDIEPGRKPPRDLDAYRRVWATIHGDAKVSRSDNS